MNKKACAPRLSSRSAPAYVIGAFSNLSQIQLDLREERLLEVKEPGFPVPHCGQLLYEHFSTIPQPVCELQFVTEVGYLPRSACNIEREPSEWLDNVRWIHQDIDPAHSARDEAKDRISVQNRSIRQTSRNLAGNACGLLGGKGRL